MAALAQPPIGSDPELPRKRWTRIEVNRLLETGIFEGQRYELIDGELIDKMGQKPRHVNGIQDLMELLIAVFGPKRVRVQAPIEAGPRDRKWSQPEPDLALLLEWKSDFKTSHPFGNELLLVVEVADSSVRQDAIRKRQMYAEAGVPEYWVLDLEARRLLVFRDLAAGEYKETLTLAETELAPHLNVLVSSLID